MEEKRRDAGTLPSASVPSSSSTARPMEMAPVEPASTRRRAGAHKRKANNGNTTSNMTPSKRLAREKPSIPLPQNHNGPLTRARLTPNNLAAAAAAAAASGASAASSQNQVELSASEAAAAAAAAAAVNAAHEDWQALEGAIEAEFEAIRSRDANAHVVPTHCGWFSWTKVHPLEEQALPSFFNGKSANRTSDIYMEIRNWIMKKFHANPNTQIELKDLSELSVGDSDTRQEVMEFLDHWGLINFHPFPPTDTATANADGDEMEKTDSVVEKLFRFETVQSSLPVVPRTNLTTPAVPSRLFPEPAITEDLVRPEGPAVEYHCNSCSADCSRKRYHCQKQADFDLCTECFNNGKFGSDMSSSDFILMESGEVPGVSGGKWTDQETLLLLEAVELFNENWNEIAEHVATKTKAQCILHFVQMPIEDTFLDCDDEIDATIQENIDQTLTNNDSSIPKDATETKETKNGACEGQPVPSPMETSKPEDASEVKIHPENGENCALKALREAFEAVGSPPMPGGPLTFVEAGNPVMALAAFLVRLVEPDVATASARSSLKSTSGNSPGIQLAARHCFLLEDPPDDKKESAGSESAVAEMVDRDAQNDENQQEKIQKEENSVSALEGNDLLNGQRDKKIEDSVEEETKPLVSSSGECTEKSDATKEPDVMVTHEEVEPVILNDSSNSELPKDHSPSTKKESDDITSKEELPPTSVKESGDEASVGEPSQPTEAPKDVDMVSDALPAEKNEPQHLVTPESTVDAVSDSLPAEKNEPQHPVTPNSTVDMVSDSLPAEKNEPQHPVTPNSAVENEANAGEDQTKDCKNDNRNSIETKDDHNMDKIKRAAIAAVSAAAVKAKLLANQEEDQIRQLATLLIEKQLVKLETKLSFFNEMESVTLRVREQMDRSRQRLYHERAQIIAARLGLPASSSRAMPQSLPTNRIAANFSNSVPRPPMNMTLQRPPPISRPMMTLAPPSSNPFSSTTVSGSSIRPSSQDKLSSVGTK
ncbi:hypothetical protein L1049_015148 [Liquidambar formosana]|uniref:SWI/SNF complex subunit SWI3D n=1 Tax=Liquidambar formosana TaxID=63359 RepID=A0AAP0S3T6_LIQFO